MEAATIGNQDVSSKVEEWANQVLGIWSPSTVVAFSTPTTPYKYLSTGRQAPDIFFLVRFGNESVNVVH